MKERNECMGMRGRSTYIIRLKQIYNYQVWFTRLAILRRKYHLLGHFLPAKTSVGLAGRGNTQVGFPGGWLPHTPGVDGGGIKPTWHSLKQQKLAVRLTTGKRTNQGWSELSLLQLQRIVGANTIEYELLAKPMIYPTILPSRAVVFAHDSCVCILCNRMTRCHILCCGEL
jgi:hypothetical protein